MTDYVQVQFDRGFGSWATSRTVINDSQYIAHAMKHVKDLNPDKRVRAIDASGRLIDFL